MNDCRIIVFFSISQHDWTCLSFLVACGRRLFSVCRYFVCCFVCCLLRLSGLQVESISLTLSALGNFSMHRNNVTSLSLMLHVFFSDSNVISGRSCLSISSVDREHFSSVSLVDSFYDAMCLLTEM